MKRATWIIPLATIAAWGAVAPCRVAGQDSCVLARTTLAADPTSSWQSDSNWSTGPLGQPPEKIRPAPVFDEGLSQPPYAPADSAWPVGPRRRGRSARVAAGSGLLPAAPAEAPPGPGPAWTLLCVLGTCAVLGATLVGALVLNRVRGRPSLCRQLAQAEQPCRPPAAP
jgi:hypothetical protein